MELDPQKTAFLKYFLDPKSPTWGNYYQSGIKAGYDDDYARNLKNQMPDWLRDNLDKSRLVQKAEKNLELALDGGLDDAEKGKKEIQWKATEMTLKTLRKEDYSERTELTGKGGGAIAVQSITGMVIKKDE